MDRLLPAGLATHWVEMMFAGFEGVTKPPAAPATPTGRRPADAPPVRYGWVFPWVHSARRFGRHLPLLFLPLGQWAVVSVLVSSMLAELLSNLHIFVVLVPNHCADDLYRFDGRPADRREALLRQVVGTANCRCGGELNDLLHLWLNYHIEHHLWPNLPMTAYRRIQPRLRRLCEDFGIPYVQQGVWRRLRMALDICVGQTSMPRMATRLR